MAPARLRPEQIERLADDLKRVVLARRDWLVQCQGPLQIHIYPHGEGFDIKISATS